MAEVASIKDSVSGLADFFKQQMAEFQSSLSKADPASPTVASVSSSFAAFKEFVLKALDMLQKQVDLVTRQVDQIEIRSRRSMLLVHGIAEAESEDTAVLVVNALQATRDNLAAVDIKRSHRLGGRSGRDKKPRVVLVEFKDTAIRDDVWFNKVELKGSGVTLGEFLTKPRHAAFMEARERFGIRSCWTRNGDVYILGKDGVKHRANSITEVKSLPTTLSAAVAAPAGPSVALSPTPINKAAPEAKQEPNKRSKRGVSKSRS
ncbi:uncharacterized protein LOC133529694 [Cydia pomonella]|uniref:uncharacterized protein LOC133524457 n=1 Tax=Cydia pomonella TaxID=82600 RepID=UPI002ADE3683|nr:uncharacterized protein LOC133524457 [Cydia pomonella]XP_061723461.1 uncharacterized protein LOC133529694 [Cydia pomonella]